MKCPYCQSKNTIKYGVRRTLQRWRCVDCSKGWSKMESIEAGMVFRYSHKDKLRVHGLTDIHVGANEFDEKKFAEAIKSIQEDDDARWFGNGDLLEFIPPNYKISQRGQYLEPDDQLFEFINLIEPIKDKCLFIRGGNHDTIRSVNLSGVDICKVMAKEMDVPYFELPGYTQFNIQGTFWNMASGHGKSGGANGDLELKRMAGIYSEAHICYLGHNHQLYAKPEDSLRINGSKESLFRRWLIRGGSFLRYAAYSRYALYPLIRTGWVTMEFSSENIEAWTN